MLNSNEPIDQDPVQARLLSAAFDLFQSSDYNKVTTRKLADSANTSPAMIKYFFVNKQGLYEEMIRQQFSYIEGALSDAYDEKRGLDLTQLFLNYRDLYLENPDHLKFVFGILTYKDGPGFKLLSEILDKKWNAVKVILEKSKNKNLITQNIDVDVFRVVVTSLAVFPYLLNDIFEQSNSIKFDNLYERVAVFIAKLLKESLVPGQDGVWNVLNDNDHLTDEHYCI